VKLTEQEERVLQALEDELMEALGSIANLFSKLPMKHPADDQEMVWCIHRLQDMIAARRTYRATGAKWL
jgi:hypothetical protein